MKKILITFVTMLLVYVSSMALEPVRVGLTYPSGRANDAVEVEVFDYSTNTKVYPAAAGRKDIGTIAPNLNDGSQFILGEGDPEWQNLPITTANPATMVRVYVGGVIGAQLKLKDLIEAQSTTGDGSVLEDGVTSSGGTIMSSDTSSIIIGGGNLDHNSGTETKMFFSDDNAAFRAGTVSGTAWDDGNLGQSSLASGENTTASGEGSVATGKNTTASGDFSSASGEGTFARATHEVAVGSYNTDYTPAGDATDRAFSIGNGTGGGTPSPSNAFVVRKNGNTEISGDLDVAGKVTIGSGATTYELPTARGTANQILQTDGSGVLTFVDNVPGLGTANTWTALQTYEAGITLNTGNLNVGTTNVDPSNGNTLIGGTLQVTGTTTLSGTAGSGNQSLYVDNNGLVTASNGDASRKASGMITGKHTATATTTQTVLDTDVKTGSVIIVTYQGTIAASHRITAITDGTSFTLEFSLALVAGETVHYMIIND